jgi:hypothetical protein
MATTWASHVKTQAAWLSLLCSTSSYDYICEDGVDTGVCPVESHVYYLSIAAHATL